MEVCDKALSLADGNETSTARANEQYNALQAASGDQPTLRQQQLFLCASFFMIKTPRGRHDLSSRALET